MLLILLLKCEPSRKDYLEMTRFKKFVFPEVKDTK